MVSQYSLASSTLSFTAWVTLVACWPASVFDSKRPVSMMFCATESQGNHPPQKSTPQTTSVSKRNPARTNLDHRSVSKALEQPVPVAAHVFDHLDRRASQRIAEVLFLSLVALLRFACLLLLRLFLRFFLGIIVRLRSANQAESSDSHNQHNNERSRFTRHSNTKHKHNNAPSASG